MEMERVVPYCLFWQLPRSALDGGSLLLLTRSLEPRAAIPAASVAWVSLGQRERTGLAAVHVIAQQQQRTFLFDSEVCAREFLECAKAQLGEEKVRGFVEKWDVCCVYEL